MGTITAFSGVSQSSYRRSALHCVTGSAALVIRGVLMSDLRSDNEETREVARPVKSLADARERAGLSQEQLAELIKVDSTTVGRLERGAQEPQPWLRRRLARALRMSLDELADVFDRMDQLARVEMGEAAVLLYKEVRRLREDAELSQPELARRVGYTRQYVSMAERPNKNLPSLELVTALDNALNAGGALLSLRAQAKAERHRRRQEVAGKAVSPEVGVDRRAFMGVAAGTLLGVTTGFHAELPSRAGDADCRRLLSRTARLRRLDNYVGGLDTYHLYASELKSTIDYVRNVNSTPTVRTKLVGVIAEQAQLAGWAAFDAGMHTEAQAHYRDSLEAAKEANDAALTGNALAFLAYQEVSTTGPNVGLAEASFAAAEKDSTPRVRALLLERQAWTYAVAGDHRSTEKALEGAKAALRMPSGRPEPDWVFWVDENEIRNHDRPMLGGIASTAPGGVRSRSCLVPLRRHVCPRQGSIHDFPGARTH